jgi:hypothetical protein
MGLFNWFRGNKKGIESDGLFEDSVDEEFGLAEEFTGPEDEESRLTRQTRIQFNTQVDKGLATALRLTAKMYQLPIYPAAEHALALGLAQMAIIAADPDKKKKLTDHLINNHFLGQEVRDSDDIRRLGWDEKKYQHKTYNMSLDTRLLRLLKALLKVLTELLTELGDIQRSGGKVSVPALMKVLYGMKRAIWGEVRLYADCDGPDPSTASAGPDAQSAGSQDETPFGGRGPDGSRPGSGGARDRIRLTRVIIDGEAREVPRKPDDPE